MSFIVDPLIRPVQPELQKGFFPVSIDPISRDGAIDTEDDDMSEDDAPEASSRFTRELVQPARIDHTVILEKQAGRLLDDDKSDIQLIDILSAVPKSSLTRGWSINFARTSTAKTYRPDAKRDVSERYELTGDRSNGWTYAVELVVSCQPKNVRSTLRLEFDNIVAAMHGRATQKQNRWAVASVDGKLYVPKDVERVTPSADDQIGYVPFEMPEWDAWLSPERDGSGAFDHLYGLDDYIEIMHQTIELGDLSGWNNRVNLCFMGPPACGKSDLLKSLKKCVGDDAVLEFDATSTTMAGAQQELYEREELPRILLIEEIEKAPTEALQWLLSILDLRGEIRKRTAKTEPGGMVKSIHMVGICTVNNVEKFREMAAGALQSRFALQLEFSRPPREILWKILEREIKKVDGDIAWIDPALDFAEEVSKLDPDGIDPRRLIAICLTGRERLLLPADDVRSYQAMLRRTMRSTFKKVDATAK